jgi:hypothetical protein
MSEASALVDKYCKKCNDIKPARTHHCNVCNQCVFVMDHHCPWVNNCLGLDNYRYFWLFCFYLWLGTCYMLVTLTSIRNHHSMKSNQSLFSFMVLLDLSLFLCMAGFVIWNSYLALLGYTTVEFFGEALQTKAADKRHYSFRFQSVSDNMFRIFGTNNFIRALSPSMRNVPFTGLEWAFLMCDLGFNQEGVKYLDLADIEMSRTKVDNDDEYVQIDTKVT